MEEGWNGNLFHCARIYVYVLYVYEKKVYERTKKKKKNTNCD